MRNTVYRILFTIVVLITAALVAYALRPEPVVVISKRAKPFSEPEVFDKPRPRVIAEANAESESMTASLWIEKVENGFDLCTKWDGGSGDDVCALAVTDPGVYNGSWVHAFDEFRLGSVFLWRADSRGYARIRMTAEPLRDGWNTCNVSFLIIHGPVEVGWGPIDHTGFMPGAWGEHWKGSKTRSLSAADLDTEPRLITTLRELALQKFPNSKTFELPVTDEEVVRVRIVRAGYRDSRTSPAPRVGISMAWEADE